MRASVSWWLIHYSLIFRRLLNSEIARLGGRTYVFADVVWDPNTNDSYVAMPDEPERNHLAHGAKYRAAKLPLRAYIDAPTSGGSWPKGVKIPRAVSNAWYERMCPPERRHLVDTKKVNTELGVNLGGAQGLEIVTKWGKYLKTLSNEPCVELVKGSDRLIDWECVIFTSIVLRPYIRLEWLIHLCGRPIVCCQTREFYPFGHHFPSLRFLLGSIGRPLYSVPLERTQRNYGGTRIQARLMGTTKTR